MICRYCDKEGADVATYAYWWAGKFWAHKDCKKMGEQEEAYECQKIDADCNDCKFFQRIKMVEKGIFIGQCTQFDKPTYAYPHMATGKDCFVHRKD